MKLGKLKVPVHIITNLNTGEVIDGNYKSSNVVPATHDDISSIEYWDKFGKFVLGTEVGMKDWMSLRDIIRGLVEAKGGVDYSTYVANLTSEEKAVAAKYVPTKIVDALGYLQLATDSGGVEQAKNNIKTYLKNSTDARDTRYGEVVSYAYQRLGKNQGLQVEDTVRQNNLRGKYIERGVLKKSEDTVDGFEDYFKSTDGFVASGLLAKLNDNTYTLIDDGSGQTKAQFVDTCVGIVKDGQY